MQSALPGGTPLPVDRALEPNSLRALMESKRSGGSRFSVQETLKLVVPLCVELAKQHETHPKLFVHPSSIKLNEAGEPFLDVSLANKAPVFPQDRACLAPEIKGTKGAAQPGDKRASVFALGAIMYELLTSEFVGPSMARPSELVPDLPETVEVILGKALVGDRQHRPDDLLALASALHNVEPKASIIPPSADVSHLDKDGEFEVDISLSMMPPPTTARRDPSFASNPLYAMAIPAPPSVGSVPGIPGMQSSSHIQAASDPTATLAQLKVRLESDTRPRYVVVHNGMDHGPFSAIELLQQIGSHNFTGENILRDELSQEEKPIDDWIEFSPFAQQAKLNRNIKAEKREIERVVVEEKKATTSKAIVGGAAVLVLVIIGVAIIFVSRGSRKEKVVVQGDDAVTVDVDGGLKSGSGKTAGVGGKFMGKGRLPTSGKHPILPGGMSCESAQSRYVEEMKIGDNGAPDLTVGQYGSVLNRGTYLNGCGVPPTSSVSVCAAVQNGRAVGVTVVLSPPDRGAASCVARNVRGLSFPANSRLDVARTSFAAQQLPFYLRKTCTCHVYDSL
jgi:eukaryotic-like serine/threonine-protein kinase